MFKVKQKCDNLITKAYLFYRHKNIEGKLFILISNLCLLERTGRYRDENIRSKGNGL